MTAAAAPTWRDDTVAWLTAALACVLAGFWAAPANSWLDSAELTACAAELGNIHPPGHPAWLSLAPAMRLLPLGPFAWRIALFSGLGAAASVFALVRLTRGLVVAHVEERAVSWLSLAAASALLASGSLWQVTSRVEVYALALATNLLALHAAFSATRHLQRGAVHDTVFQLAVWVMAVCLGLLNHHYVTLFALPASLWAAFPAVIWVWRTHPRVALGLLLAGAWLGLGYVSLGLRAMADTEMRWGDPSTPAGLWDTVTARHFQKSVTEVHVDRLANFAVLGGMVAEEMSWPVGVLGLLGLVLAGLLRERRVGVLALAFVGALATMAIMRIDTTNPDNHGYVLMAPAMLALGVAYLLAFVVGERGLLATVTTHVRLRLAQVGTGGVLLVTGAQVWALSDAPPHQLGNLRATDVVDTQLRAQLPPGAVFLANYYGLAFNEQAFRLAEGRRPDIVAAHLSLRMGDTDHGVAWQTWFARRHPTWAPVFASAQQAGHTPVEALLAWSATQPVFAEQDPDLRIPPAAYVTGGVAQRLQPPDSGTTREDRQGHRAAWAAMDAQLGPVADGPSRAVLLWQHALEVAHALRMGWPDLAHDELVAAAAINPGDRLLAHLQHRLDALTAARNDLAQVRTLLAHWSTMDFATLASDAP